MNFASLYKQLLSDFNLQDLPVATQKEMLLEIAKTIQKQFLLDVYDILGEEKFSALQASATMGEEFYATTLKHLVPSYEEVFLVSRMKILSSFHKEMSSE